MNRLGELLGSVLGLGLVALYIWGVGWSFHRFGAGQATMAFMLPPYGVYRGIASAWDEPEWKDKYDVRTEQLAIAIEYSVSNSQSDRSKSLEENHLLRNWISQVPPDEKIKLREASRNYGSAIVGCSSAFATALLNNRIDIHPCANSDVQQRVAGFQNIPGFMSAWTKVVQTMESDAKAASTAGREKEIDPAASERLETWLRVMDAKMNGTISEIFSAP